MFQRTANYCASLRNGPIASEAQREIKASYPESFKKWLSNFYNAMASMRANEDYTEFVQRKIRTRVKAPGMAAKTVALAAGDLVGVQDACDGVEHAGTPVAARPGARQGCPRCASLAREHKEREAWTPCRVHHRRTPRHRASII